MRNSYRFAVEVRERPVRRDKITVGNMPAHQGVPAIKSIRLILAKHGGRNYYL